MESGLKDYIKRYRDIDNSIRQINKNIYDLRERRKEIEVQITSILKSPQFAQYKILKLEDDGSTIKVQRPNEWNKPWSLSKADLRDGLNEFFAQHGTDMSELCFNYIVERQKKKLVATEFAITRTVPNENLENE